jgi:1-acyl-sn-glycerol-3-phosphate acyltransferase
MAERAATAAAVAMLIEEPVDQIDRSGRSA